MKLPLDFYRRETIAVARELLGQRLVRVLPNGQRLSGLIVETEAYLGEEDPACHTFAGLKSKRNLSMYLEGGHSYIYLIYGMYHCFNVVTQTASEPEAVLIRALMPEEGLTEMQKRRPKAHRERDLTNGPGKLCKALEIDLLLNGLRLDSELLFIEKSAWQIPEQDVDWKPRVGVDYAGDAAQWPLRLCVKNHPFVSK